MKRSLRGLTIKQQAKIRSRFFRALLSMGFKYNEHARGGYYSRLARDNSRDPVLVCVGFGVENQCLGGRTCWIWQDSKENESPSFGYSNSCHVGAEYGTMERLMSVTLERIYSVGFSHGLAVERMASAEAKRKITEAIASLHSI